METLRLRRRINVLLWFFTIALIVSGLTAIPLKWEVGLLQRFLGTGTWLESYWPDLARWVAAVQQGINDTAIRYPFMFYGTDWLAFGHLMIAIAFIGALRDPVRNVWIVRFGMVACVLVIAWAFAFGQIRGIPFFWRIVDSAFGIIGIIPLWIANRDINRLAARMH